MKWIELNVGINRTNPDDKILMDTIKPILNQFKKNINSWHFLWENKPWPKLKGKGKTLRVRFFGKNKDIEKLKIFLDKKFQTLEKKEPTYYFGHCFGRHGDCGNKYAGEDTWGTEAWKMGMKFLNLGSDFALELIKNKNKLGKTPIYLKDVSYYADRYCHLFLNQIGSLTDEAIFYFTQLTGRLNLTSTQIKEILEIINK